MTVRVKTFAIAALIFALVLSVKSAATAQSAVPNTPAQLTLKTFKQLGQNDILLQGSNPSSSISIPFQSDWQVTHAELDIHYFASQIISNQRSTLTVSINGTNVISIQPQTDNVEHDFRVIVPDVLLTGNGLTVGFSAYLQLATATCFDVQNPAHWLTVGSNSTVSISSIADNSRLPKLSELPNAIVVQNGYSPTPVLFVLPDNPDPVTLTTASQTAAWLGRAAFGIFPIQVTTYKTLKAGQLASANVVLVGTRNSLPLMDTMAIASGLPVPATANGYLDLAGKPVPSNNAVIQIFTSPWNIAHRALLVSAGDLDGLKLAGNVFADQATVKTLSNSAAIVTALVPKSPTSTPFIWSLPNATFTQLGKYQQDLTGENVFNQYSYFRLPPGWLVANGSQIVLKFAFSPVLNPNTSYIAAFINGQPVGSLRIGQNVTDNEMLIPLPFDMINGGEQGSSQTIELHLTIASYLNIEVCKNEPRGAAWVTIYPNSTVSLKHTYMSLPDLQAFPYPFVSDNATVPTTIVLPSTPQNADLVAAFEIASTLGQFARTDFQLQTVLNSATLKDSQANANLIILGARDSQPLIDQFSALMLKDATDPSTANAVTQAHTPDAAFWQEGVSPWNKNRTVLLISGGSAAAFARSAFGLAQSSPPVTTFGQIALVDNTNTGHTILQQATPTPIATAAATAQAVGTAAATASASNVATAIPTAAATGVIRSNIP